VEKGTTVLLINDWVASAEMNPTKQSRALPADLISRGKPARGCNPFWHCFPIQISRAGPNYKQNRCLFWAARIFQSRLAGTSVNPLITLAIWRSAGPRAALLHGRGNLAAPFSQHHRTRPAAQYPSRLLWCLH